MQRDGLEVGERHEDLLAQRAQVVVVHAHGLHAVFRIFTLRREVTAVNSVQGVSSGRGSGLG